MFFSIIIPTYNREKIISRSIKSILGQSFDDYEIIIVDDGSRDNTKSTVESFADPRLKYFKTENFGVAHARNTGIKNAAGQYIGFLDSDDLMEDYHLQTAYDFIKMKNKPEIIHLNFLWGTENKSVVHKNKLPRYLPNDVFKACSLHVNCLFIKCDIARKNLFNESRELMFAEDWDFFIKLSIRYSIRFLDKPTTYLIDHEDRSMRDFNEEKWLSRRDALVSSLEGDEIIQRQYLHKIKIVKAHMNSLIAISLAARKSKIKALKYWRLSVLQDRNDILTKRTLAIIKHLLFSW